MITETTPILEAITKALDLIEDTMEHDGGTYFATTLERAKLSTGYMVASKRGAAEFTLGQFDSLDVILTIGKIGAIIQSQPDRNTWYIGTWIHMGQLYIEPAKHVAIWSDALRMAQAEQQISIYNNRTEEALML